MFKVIVPFLFTAVPILSLACSFPDLSPEMIGKTSDAVKCNYRIIGKKSEIKNEVCAYLIGKEQMVYLNSNSSFTLGDMQTKVNDEQYNVLFHLKNHKISISGKTTSGFFGDINSIKSEVHCEDRDLDAIILSRYLGKLATLDKQPIAIKSIDKLRQTITIRDVASRIERVIDFKELKNRFRHLQIVNHNVIYDNSERITEGLLEKISQKRFLCFKQDPKKEGFVLDKQIGILTFNQSKCGDGIASVTFSAGLESRNYGANLYMNDKRLKILRNGSFHDFRIVNDGTLARGEYFIDLQDLKCFAE